MSNGFLNDLGGFDTLWMGFKRAEAPFSRGRMAPRLWGGALYCPLPACWMVAPDVDGLPLEPKGYPAANPPADGAFGIGLAAPKAVGDGVFEGFIVGGAGVSVAEHVGGNP